jgi:2-dehydro-3-deoxyphosphooctonate aldolase (KDO 8-P synthase)
VRAERSGAGVKGVDIGEIRIGGGAPLVLIAGPCVVESRDLVLRTAGTIQTIARRQNVPLIFKSSYKKANRTSAKGFAGIGTEEALRVLAAVKQEFGLPVLTDVHSESEVPAAAEIADVLQIPAFLCRQTELLQAAGRTGRVVNIKKGQFMAPGDMRFAAEKVLETGNAKILLTERGTVFGYHDLVVDMRSLAIMRDLGYPVVFDGTHSVQLPSQEKDGTSSGNPEFILPLSRAAVAAGCDGVFLEVHPDPPRALSDAGSQLKLELLEKVLEQVLAVDRLVRTLPGGQR